jgi:hypothetical protein
VECRSLIGRQRLKRRSHALGFTGVTVDGAQSSMRFRCEEMGGGP